MLVLLGLTLAARPAGAQVRIADEPVFTTYGTRDGMSHGAVHALVQDRSGFLWIGTQDGLNRFDGVRFRAYRHSRDDPESLGDDFVRALALAPDGRLWVGTERAGLNLFDPWTGIVERFELFDLGPWMVAASGPEDRAGRSVRGIVVQPDSSLYLASDLGIIHFDPRTREAQVLGGVATTPWLPPPLCAFGDADVLVGDADGAVSVIERGQNILRRRWTLNAAVTALRCPTSGSSMVLAGTADGALHTLDLASGVAQRTLRVQPEVADSTTVRDVLTDPSGNVWIGSNRGLFLSAPGSAHARRIGNGSRRMIPDAEVSSLLVDATGVLWVGTWNGLSALHPLAMRVRRVPNRQAQLPGLAGNGVIAIEAIGDEIWLGTNAGGVQVLHRDSTGTLTLTRPPALAGLEESRVFDLTLGPGGELWIATLDEGIIRLDPDRRRATPCPIVSLDGTPIDAARTLAVHVDRNGDVWASSREFGLLRLDRAARRFVAWRGPGGDWDFGSEYTWPIVEDASGTLWVGAYNGGLSAIDPARRTLRFYGAGPGGLSDDRVLTVFPDSRGFIWIGTEGGGLNRLDPQTGEFAVLTVADGLPHDNVEAITEDRRGNLWISTNDGLVQYDPEGGRLHVFRESAGLAGSRFFANAVHRHENGELIFGGESGLTLFDPAHFDASDTPPPIALTAFHIQGREQPLVRTRDPAGLVLEPNENFFTFTFAALDFRDPARNRYRHRLVDLDEEWVDNGSSQVANYTSVPAGRYTLRISAMGEDGVWNENGLSLAVRVKAPYYETAWFRTLLALAVLGLISSFYAYRMQELQKRQNLRLSLAGRLHDDIGANLSTIALKADMLAAVPALDERRRNQVADVGRLARESAHKVRETVWVVNTQYDTLTGLITKMRDTADVMLGGQLQFAFRAPDVLPDRSIGMEFRQNVYFVFKETLQNILKHARASTVDIEIAVDARRLRLRVHDNGVGIDMTNPPNGNGLGLMRQRAARHNGEFTVAGGSGAGTTVLLDVRIR